MYYFDSTQKWDIDKSMLFNKLDWWDCTEFAYHWYNKISKIYPATIVIGEVYFRNNLKNDWTGPIGHAWVEYLKDGELKRFDFLLKNHKEVKHITFHKGVLVYNFIRTEQFLRSLGFEAFIKAAYMKDTHEEFMYIVYKLPYFTEWTIYHGQFDELRTEEFEWVNTMPR